MRTVVFAALVLGLGILILPPPTAAEDRDPSRLELRVYSVGSLVIGRYHHSRAQRSPLDPSLSSNEEPFYFGASGEEPIRPYGVVYELLELVWRAVEPQYWEEAEGAWMNAEDADRLIVRASPDMHRKVETFLAELQADIGSTVSVELQLLRFGREKAGAGPEAALATVLTDEAAAALAGRATERMAASLTCFSGQRGAIFAGRQMAYLQDGEVEIAKDDAATTDPIVEVTNLGLLASVWPVLHGERVLLTVDAEYVAVGAMRGVVTEANGRFEAPPHDAIAMPSVLEMPLGRWAVAAGGAAGDAAWLCLVRATATPYESLPGQSTVVNLGRPLLFEEGRMATARIDIRDLLEPVAPVAGEEASLWPSDYVRPESPELPEPSPTLSEKALEKLLALAAEGEVWEEPASCETRGGTLRVRNRSTVIDAVSTVLGKIRTKVFWNLITTAEIVEVPENLAASLGPQGVLTEAKDAALQQARRAGLVRTLDTVRLTNQQGVRNVVRAGREIPYLQDYEVEIAQASKIGNPIVQKVLSGVHLDLRAGRSPDGGSVQLDVELQRNVVDLPIRTVETEHGPIELPSMEHQCVRTAVQVPLGRTALVASWTENGRRRLLLLTPHLR